MDFTFYLCDKYLQQIYKSLDVEKYIYRKYVKKKIVKYRK